MKKIQNGIERVLKNLYSATLTVSEMEDLFEDAESFTEGLSSMGKVNAVMTYVLTNDFLVGSGVILYKPFLLCKRLSEDLPVRLKIIKICFR